MPKVDTPVQTFARIKVIGVGGSGKNALNHMITSKVKGVELINMNTDTQDLHNSLADKKIHIGKNLTKGLGAGMNPDVGKRAAEETKSEIQDVIKGADMVFIACGMGGGTGTGAAPIVARAAKEQGILTVAVVTRPFFFEGNHRMRLADQGLAELEQEVDAIIVIPNDRLLAIASKDTGLKEAFALSDEVLRQAVEGISELITTPGTINLDFADIKAVISDAGTALMGVGYASGENRAEQAAIMAINSPLLEVSINGAKGVLYAISGNDDMTLNEIQQASKVITDSVDKDAKIFFGTIKDERLKKGEIKITVIATGFPTDSPKKSLFQGPSQTFGDKQGISSITKEDVFPTRKEIHNSIQQPASGSFTVKTDTPAKKTEIIEEVYDEEIDDDWSAVPSIFRSKKK